MTRGAPRPKPKPKVRNVSESKPLCIDVYTFIHDQLNDECALIVCHPTGVFYDAQCGGNACTHPSAEGFFLPMWDFCPELDDCEYGCAELTKSTCFDKPELREKLACAIENELETFNRKYGFKLFFDRSRIDELQEGWWPLRIVGVFGGSYPDLELDHNCYFHKGNCD